MITRKDIEKLADLARIHLDDSEKDTLASEIDAILGYVVQLQKASQNAPEKSDFLRNVFRDDMSPHETGIFTEQLLVASPDRAGQYFKVKKILNQD